MADNTTLNSGSGGDTIASDDIGGIKHQRVKLSLGADGTAVDAVPVVDGLDTTATGVQAVGIVGQFDDVATGAVTENQFAPVRISTRRALLVEGVASGTAIPISAASLPLPTGAATESSLSAMAGDLGDTADAAATAGGTGTALAKLRLITSQLDVGTGGFAKAEDVASADGDRGVPALAVQKATPANTSGTDGDYEFLQISAGRLWTSTTVTDIIPGTAATNQGKAEDAGHTTGDTGIMALGVRNDTPNTATTNTDADYSQLSTDRVGGIRTALYETDFAVLGTNHVKKYYTNAGAATDGIIWSPAAGKRWYVTDIFIGVSAACTVTLEDDLAAGDSPVWKHELAANSGWSHHFGTPLFSGEDAADLLVTTTAGNVYVTVTGYEI